MDSRQTTSERLAALLAELRTITVATDIDPQLLDDLVKEARRLAGSPSTLTGEYRAIEIHANYIVDRVVETYAYTCEDCHKSLTAEGLPGTFRRKVCDPCALKRRRGRQRDYMRRKREKSMLDAPVVDHDEESTSSVILESG